MNEGMNEPINHQYCVGKTSQGVNLPRNGCKEKMMNDDIWTFQTQINRKIIWIREHTTTVAIRWCAKKYTKLNKRNQFDSVINNLKLLNASVFLFGQLFIKAACVQ